MVKRTITITTILLILSIAISLIIVLNKSSFAADGDIASGTSGTCSWVIDSQGVLTISPTDGVSGQLESYTQNRTYQRVPWGFNSRLGDSNNTLGSAVTKVVVTPGVKAGAGCAFLFDGVAATEFDLVNLDLSETTNVSDMFYMCRNVTDLSIVETWDISNFTKIDGMFAFCSKLTSLDLSNWDTTNVISFNSMFYDCTMLTSIGDISGWNTSKVTDMRQMFYDCSSLQSVDVSNFDTTKVTNMQAMFRNCKLLTEIDVSQFETGNVTSIGSMFEGCSNVTELDIGHFDVSKVKYMTRCFKNCSKVTSLDVRKWNTIGLESIGSDGDDPIGSMFYGCIGLTEIDVSSFDTSKAQSIKYMFAKCTNLKILNLSTFDTTNMWNMVGAFEGCTSLEYLDISSFNTSKTIINSASYGLKDMFKDCPKLKYINLGEDFKFYGQDGVASLGWAILPTPNEPGYSGKWIRTDNEYGPYTPSELQNNYNGSTMSGIWTWEISYYSVSYRYSGTIPEGASELPAEKTYTMGEIVQVAENASAPGYTFSGWSKIGTFEMPAQNVVITGSFTPRTDTPYKVEHYLEDITEGSYTLTKTDSLTGTTDNEVEATAKEYEGFTFDNTIEGTKQSGNIAGDGSLVLKLYYKRNSYNVTYAYTGDVPDGASELPQSVTYKYGEEIKVPENATAEGYTFSGWIKDYITMPAQDIVITGYFIKEPRLYKIEYYFDNELDEALVEILNAEKDEEINLTPQTPVKHGEKNYTLVSNNHKITISVNDEDNVIRVYYETDVLDYAIDNFEDTTEGDGIPDKYQISITYKVENGNWNDGTTNTKTDIITIKDKDGNLSEEGTGTTNIPEVGNKPSEGYEVGSWNEEIPIEVSNKDDGKEFVYSYKKSEKQNVEQKDTDITDASGKIYNPKTDDIVNKYLLVGVGGLLVLALVSKIRRKYSRKAKKVQY